MVTHDAYSASYAKRVLFLKDGRVFNELLRGERGRPVFYHEILDAHPVLYRSGVLVIQREGQAYVFLNSQGIQQIEVLEHEAQTFPAELCQRFFGQNIMGAKTTSLRRWTG